MYACLKDVHYPVRGIGLLCMPVDSCIAMVGPWEGGQEAFTPDNL